MKKYGIQYRYPKYDGQPKWNVRAKMMEFMNTGHPQYGNLREQHVIADFVYADTPELAKKIYEQTGRYVWVEVDTGEKAREDDNCPF